jgi:selenide, water dikinase
VYPDEDAAFGLVLTIDVITPLVDDPFLFGAIAAANALSDVYAMGGVPQVALSFVGVPDVVSLEMLGRILAGVTDKVHEAKAAIVGGHSIRDAEPKVGLAVVGSVERDRAWTHSRGEAGQKLCLTKPIGTGVIAHAVKNHRLDPDALDEAARWMVRLNRAARDAGRRHGATAATDVTGFGLLGHTQHLCAASRLEAVIDVERVKILDGALDAARDGQIPGGSKRNASYVAAHLSGTDRLAPELVTVLTDAQTSGGLLLALPADRADALVAELGEGTAVIGELRHGTPGRIVLR